MVANGEESDADLLADLDSDDEDVVKLEDHEVILDDSWYICLSFETFFCHELPLHTENIT